MHMMRRTGDVDDGTRHIPGVTSVDDYFGLAIHGGSNTHIDALCHVFFRGHMYNGFPSARVTSGGALNNSVDAVQDGIASGGELRDSAEVEGLAWLEPGTGIYIEDLEEAEKRAGVRVEPGDILLVRTGIQRFRQEHSGDGAFRGMAGMHGSVLPWLHE